MKNVKLLRSRLLDYIFSLKATQLWFHAAHHVAKGSSFAGDHANLYGEIYATLSEHFDGAVEKAIGNTNGDESVACPLKITEGALMVLELYPSPTGQAASSIAALGYQVIKNHYALTEDVFADLDAAKSLPLGLNDFLASNASDYDKHLYLLGQRVKEVVG